MTNATTIIAIGQQSTFVFKGRRSIQHNSIINNNTNIFRIKRRIFTIYQDSYKRQGLQLRVPGVLQLSIYNNLFFPVCVVSSSKQIQTQSSVTGSKDRAIEFKRSYHTLQQQQSQYHKYQQQQYNKSFLSSSLSVNNNNTIRYNSNMKKFSILQKKSPIMSSWTMISLLMATTPSLLLQKRQQYSSIQMVVALPFGTRGGVDNTDDNENIVVIDPSSSTSTNEINNIAFVTSGSVGNNINSNNMNEAIIDPRFGDIKLFHVQDHPSIDTTRFNHIVHNFFTSTAMTTSSATTSTTTTSSTSKTNTTIIPESSDQLLNEIKSVVTNMTDFLLSTRRLLHKHPELMFQEQFTSKTVQVILQHLNVSYTTGWAINTKQYAIPGPGGYGIVADIGTGHPPCILLRADMDALPIFERTENIDSFKSIYDNKMHACGHDAHTTMLLGAVTVLKQIESSIPGTIRIMFQPAEEGGAGAKRMIEEGLLDKYPKPQYGFGMHVWPSLDSGTIASRPGPIMAACERFEILISGVGGHAAMPHLTIDPVVTASAIVMNLQTIVSRSISPLESGVCSITQIDTGSGAFNVIPHSAMLKGTIRSLSTEGLLQLRDSVQHIVDNTAAVYKCNATITYSPDYYPVTVNDPILYNTFSKNVGTLLAKSITGSKSTTNTNNNNKGIEEIVPTMGAEDFSFIAQRIPSTFFWLGQGSGNNPITNYGLHHPHFALDESILSTGVELHVNLALRSIAQLQQIQSQQTQQ